VCVDRVGAFDDLSEGFFVGLSPTTPARPESQRALGHACPTRQARVDQLGLSTPSSGGSGLRIDEIATHYIFHIFIAAIDIICPCMIYVMMLLPTERDRRGDPPGVKPYS
jgi:hypothetical protein